MPLILMRRPLLAIVLTLILPTAGLAQSSLHVERSAHLRYGQVNGFQEVRHNADGSISVHFEYNDRGRGPKLDTRYTIPAG